jgi:hypothetical protein
MRREFLFATVLAAAMSIGASAQSGTGQAGTAGQGGTMAPSSSADQTREKQANVTLTGCIENGSPSSSSAPGTAGTSGSYGSSDTMGTSGSSSNAARSKNGQFVLTNVAGGAAAVSASDRVVLSGKDKDLEKNLGHKVEITGKWENSGSTNYSGSGSTAGTSGTAATAGSTGSASGTGSTSYSSSSNAQANGTFKVSSVKVVSGSCSRH